MPAGDKTGPTGQGPMTGRKMGFCSGNDSPGFSNSGTDKKTGRGIGGGLGRGRNSMRGAGSGRGFRNRVFWNDNSRVAAADTNKLKTEADDSN